MKDSIVIIVLLLVILLSSESGICQSKQQDDRLLGKWSILFFKDTEGKIIKNGFEGKNYVDVFYKNGTYSVDPNYFRDEMKRNGINEPLDYTSLPVFTWRNMDDNLIEIITTSGNQQIRYGFSGDTLLLGYPNGNIKYLLKRK